MSQLLTLDDALQSVGFCKQASWPFDTNVDLSNGTNPTRLVLVDWHYFASPVSGDPGSKLYDDSTIVYDFVPQYYVGAPQYPPTSSGSGPTGR